MRLALLFALSLGALDLAAAPFLRVQKNRFVDRAGAPTTLRGVSWFGMETETNVPHGLWAREYRELLREIRQLGFNAVRIPFSNRALEETAKAGGISAEWNPELVGRKPIEALDRIVDEAEALGLAIILDRHRPTPSAQSALWYTDEVPESRWIADWVWLARRYRHRPSVVGFELHNEPHGETRWRAWRDAARRAASAVLEVHPDALFFIQGVQHSPAGAYWWGGNLVEAATHSLRLAKKDRVVYVSRDYPSTVYAKPWFHAPEYPANLPGIWRRFWAIPALQASAPLVLGEFGSKLETDSDRAWLETLVRFLEKETSGFIYWSLNPNFCRHRRTARRRLANDRPTQDRRASTAPESLNGIRFAHRF
jgi:aryl-phospho-beta-D-glucosidase BglC (GH1 family)